MLLLTNKTIEKLKHDLVRENLVDIDGLTLAENNAIENDTNLATELVNSNLISEISLLNFIESKLHIPSVELEDYTPDIECLTFITGEQALKYNIFPLFKIEDVLTIAMSDPLDLFTINTLFSNDSLLIEPVVASELSIKNAINTYYFNKSVDIVITNWQNKLIGDNLTDEMIKEAINDMLSDAIQNDSEHIFLECFHSGLNIYFNNDLKGFIPNILVPRFLYELKSITNLDNDMPDVAQTAKSVFKYNKHTYNIVSSVFPASFGNRIALSIYQPLTNIDEYNISRDKIDEIFAKSQFIGIDAKNNSDFMYSLATYLGTKFKVLIVENLSKFELQNVTQFEYKKNVGINFDEIINQIELQKFDIVFWEKIYTDEQFAKLKLLSNDIPIVALINHNNSENFDFIIKL